MSIDGGDFIVCKGLSHLMSHISSTTVSYTRAESDRKNSVNKLP